jgi:hypothetical protein
MIIVMTDSCALMLNTISFDYSRSVIHNSRVMLQLVASFTTVIYVILLVLIFTKLVLNEPDTSKSNSIHTRQNYLCTKEWLDAEDTKM